MQTRRNHNLGDGSKNRRRGQTAAQDNGLEERAMAAPRSIATAAPADKGAEGPATKASSPMKMVFLVFFLPIIVIVALGFLMR